MEVTLSDMIGWLIQHWNDILTVITFVLTSVLAFYKIRDYRREIADIEIREIREATFGAGGYQRDYTKFSFYLDVANTGREPAYIMDITLEIDGIDEELQCTNHQRTEGRTFNRIELGMTERDEIYLVAVNRELHENKEEFHGQIRLDTSTGEITKSITFQR